MTTTEIKTTDIDQIARSGVRPSVTAEGTKLGDLQAARGRLYDSIEGADNAEKLAEDLTKARAYYQEQVSTVGQERARRILESKGADRLERAIYGLRVDLLRQQLAGTSPDDRSEAVIEATGKRDVLTLEAVLEAPSWQDISPPDAFAGPAREALDKGRGLGEVLEIEGELERMSNQLAGAAEVLRELENADEPEAMAS